MRGSVPYMTVAAVAGLIACGDSPSSPPLPGSEATPAVHPVVRAFVEEAVADLEKESRIVWENRDTKLDGQFTFDLIGSGLALLGTTAFFDASTADPPFMSLESAPTDCLDRFGHRLWRDLNRCHKLARDPSTYTSLLFIAERPRDELDARHVLEYVSDDGEATIVYPENPTSRWDVVRRPALTATSSIDREVRVEVGGETFDLRHTGTVEIEEVGAGAVTFDLWFPVPRLVVELRVNFVSDFAATGTITKGTRTVGSIGGVSSGLTFHWATPSGGDQSP